MNKKIVCIIVLLFLGVLSVGLYFLIDSSNPPGINDYRWITISGEVKPYDTNNLENRPKYVRLYFPYYEPQYLCRSEQFGLAEIGWINETHGSYSITLEVPKMLKKVTLTTDCSLCEYNDVFIPNDDIESDVFWGYPECIEQGYSVPEDVEKVINDADLMKEGVEEEMIGKRLNSSEKESIEEDLRDVKGFIRDSKNSNQLNESLLYAYYSYWSAWRARYKLRLFELKYCIEDIKSLLEAQNNMCPIPDYESYKEFLSLNNTYQSKSMSSILRGNAQNYRNITEIVSKIKYLKRNMGYFSEDTHDCERAFNILNESFEFQKPYCETRANSVLLFNVILLIIFLGVGILIGQRL